MQQLIRREGVYLWYYFTIQLEQIFPYWLLGMVMGSFISVFLKKTIHTAFEKLKGKRIGGFGILLASGLGIASPLCMYGTIPIAASFSQSGMEDDWLGAFMMSSVLLNPQLILYSGALGKEAFWIRLASTFLCGVGAGLLLRVFYRGKGFFNFEGFKVQHNRDTDPNLMLRFLKNLGRNMKATGPYFLIGMALSVLFQRYVPAEWIANLFGQQRGFGVLLAATIGVPLYVCGGGTIPLLLEWLHSGMSLGAASAFMITGPATKITNLGALKIVLGMKHFLMYLLYVMLFSVCTGWLVNGLL